MNTIHTATPPELAESFPDEITHSMASLCPNSEASSTATFATSLALQTPPPQSQSHSRHSLSNCIVCMDRPKDTLLSPCAHAHTCLPCYQRTKRPICPVCRAPVHAVIHNGLCVPNLPTHEDRSQSRFQSIHSSDHFRIRVRNSTRRHTSRISHRSSVSSSVSVAHQAASSVRSLSRAQDEALRLLRQTGSVRPAPIGMRVLGGEAATAAMPGRERERMGSVMLIGNCRKLLAGLAEKLLAMYPGFGKANLCVDGRSIRLVLMEVSAYGMSAEFVRRVQRQSPRLILLCADYYNVSSFEAVVRLDMEMLDYLKVASVWVLVKSARVKRGAMMVDEADVRVANHFFSRQRRYLVASVHTPLVGSGMRRLGRYVERCVRVCAPVPARERTVGWWLCGVRGRMSGVLGRLFKDGVY